jgi:hypothetical protein
MVSKIQYRKVIQYLGALIMQMQLHVCLVGMHVLNALEDPNSINLAIHLFILLLLDVGYVCNCSNVVPYVLYRL